MPAPARTSTTGPSSADKPIAVAAVDASRAQLPGANINFAGGPVQAINANEAPLPAGPHQIKVLRNDDGTVSLGCDPDEYVDVEDKIVVTLRGTCARVARAIFGEQAGAAAVVMINTATAFPPFEGPIEENPDTGEEFLVTIPFLGVRGLLGPDPVEDPDRLVAADGQFATLTASGITNPGFLTLASFTSGGPRNPDSIAKPDVTAPGVSVFSTNVGTGFRGAYISGTSMATPVTAGVSALIREAHPSWTPAFVKGALMNTAEAGPTKFISGYDPRLAGAGAVQADRAVATVAMTTTPNGRNTLSYGYDQLTAAYSETQSVTINNTGGSPLTYDLAATFVGNPRGTDFTFSPSSVTVPAGGSATVDVTVALTGAEVAALPPAVASNFGTLANAVRGVVVASPTTTGAGVLRLRVPFMWVPRGLSNVEVTRNPGLFNPTIALRNSGIHTGTADRFVLAQTDPNDVPPVAEDSTDIRAVGMQTLPREALCGSDPIGVCGQQNDVSLVFAINVWGFYANPSVSEFDILVNTDADEDPEYRRRRRRPRGCPRGRVRRQVRVVCVRCGEQRPDQRLGRRGTAERFDDVAATPRERHRPGRTAGGESVHADRVPGALVLDGSRRRRRGVDARRQHARRHHGTGDDRARRALRLRPRAPSPAIVLAPGESALMGIPNSLLQLTLGAKGWMIVTHDDANGPPQADLVPAPNIPFSLP